ncbi:MAG: porin [Gemmatimonadota bacterium]
MSNQLHAQTIDAGPVKLKLLGRTQVQFSTTSVEEEELLEAGRPPAAPIPRSMFETRRVRLGAELEYEKWLTGKLEMEFAMARLQVRDAYLNMGFKPEFQLRVGQFKKPFSLLQLTSTSIWPVIERGVRIRGLADALTLGDSLAGGESVLSRFQGTVLPGEEQELLEIQGFQSFDLGASAHGSFGAFAYHVGVFNGAGADRADDTDAKSWAGRVTYKFGKGLPITLGAGASHREFRLRSRPTIETRDGTAYEADLEIGAFRRNGVHLLAEVTKGSSLADPEADFFGAQAIVSYFVPLKNDDRFEGLEFAGRVSHGDPSDMLDGDDGLLLTPGVNLYFYGRNRLMLNWDFYRAGSDRFSNENALRAQAQFYF